MLASTCRAYRPALGECVERLGLERRLEVGMHTALPQGRPHQGAHSYPLPQQHDGISTLFCPSRHMHTHGSHSQASKAGSDISNTSDPSQLQLTALFIS